MNNIYQNEISSSPLHRVDCWVQKTTWCGWLILLCCCEVWNSPGTVHRVGGQIVDVNMAAKLSKFSRHVFTMPCDLIEWIHRCNNVEILPNGLQTWKTRWHILSTLTFPLCNYPFSLVVCNSKALSLCRGPTYIILYSSIIVSMYIYLPVPSSRTLMEPPIFATLQFSQENYPLKL